jgi:hypothetical protein
MILEFALVLSHVSVVDSVKPGCFSMLGVESASFNQVEDGLGERLLGAGEPDMGKQNGELALHELSIVDVCCSTKAFQNLCASKVKT